MELEKDEVLRVIGLNIKRARLLKGFTQEELSEKLNKSTNFISLIERGSSGFSLTTLVDLCNILQIDASFVFNGLITVTDSKDSLTTSLSVLQGEDRAIVDNLVNYIIKSKD